MKVKVDRVSELAKAIHLLVAKQVLVGIPAENAERKPEPGESVEITNVVIGWVQEKGDPRKNIPARPFLVPGVEGALPTLIPMMRKAGSLAIEFKAASAINDQLVRVGIEAASAVQMKILTGPFQMIADATKRARLYRKAGYKNASAMNKTRMMETWLGGDFTPLIDSGQLRRAVTFAVRTK